MIEGHDLGDRGLGVRPNSAACWFANLGQMFLLSETQFPHL